MKLSSGTIIILLVTVASCVCQIRTAATEYAVYQAVLRAKYIDSLKQDPNGEAFVIISQTIDKPTYAESDNKRTVGLLRNFRKRNEQTATLDARFFTQTKTYVVETSYLQPLFEKGRIDAAERFKPIIGANGKRINRLIQCGSDWLYFDQRFPRVNGYYQFSRVGFSSSKKYAAVEIQGLGGCWDASGWYLLKKSSRAWKVVKTAVVESVE